LAESNKKPATKSTFEKRSKQRRIHKIESLLIKLQNWRKLKHLSSTDKKYKIIVLRRKYLRIPAVRKTQ
jgi:hypothetical protein